MFPLIVKLADEVTVSSLPHPISMFFLGIFAVTIIFMLIEVKRFKKENMEMKSTLVDFEKRFSECLSHNEVRISEISKKIDSRVDKALLSFKKTNKVQD